jgi:hypothetical protein
MSETIEPWDLADREKAVKAAMEYSADWLDRARKLQEDLEYALDQVHVGTEMVRDFSGSPGVPSDPPPMLIIDGGVSDSEESSEI